MKLGDAGGFPPDPPTEGVRGISPAPNVYFGPDETGATSYGISGIDHRVEVGPPPRSEYPEMGLGDDPWAHLKTDPNFYYRGISTKKEKLSIRQHQGYEIVNHPDAEYGDLVLARMPKKLRSQREKRVSDRQRNMEQEPRNLLEEEADRFGVKIHGRG